MRSNASVPEQPRQNLHRELRVVFTVKRVAGSMSRACGFARALAEN